MRVLGGVLRLRFWLQLVTLALLAVCASYAFSAVAATSADGSTDAPLRVPPLASAGQSAAGPYTRSTVATFRYGSGTADLGLRKGADRRPAGPVSFAVDRSGRIVVADVANGRIQVFGSDGKHERSLPAQGSVRDLAFDEAGGLLALGADGSLTTYDAVTGRQGERWSVAPELSRSLGLLRATDGSISLETPEQRSYAVYAGGSPVSAKSQQGSQKKGAPARAGFYYSTSYRNQGHLFRLDGQGRVVLDVALNLPNVASANFLGEDRSGALYVQVERFQEGNKVAVEVRRFDREGALTATIPVPGVTYLEMTRSLLVVESGDIYQLLPSEDGAAVLRWRKS